MAIQVKTEPLTERVYTALQRMILERELKPGEKIFQENLAQKLAVSRTPLVKALRILERERLVEIIPNRGAFVKKFSNKEMLWIYDIREVLEGIAVRELAYSITDDQIGALRKIFENFLNPGKKIDYDAYERADMQFHHQITEICSNEILSQINTSFHVLVRTYQEGLTRTPAETLPEHMAIIDALAGRDDELSEKLMRDHLRKAKRSFERKILSEL